MEKSLWFRLMAVVVAVAFLTACTRTVARKPLEERHYRVDWEKLDAQQIRLKGGLVVDSAVLTPAQWPLEASLKRLLQLDFIGVFTDFDLRFSSSTLNHETLRKLFDEGYIPALMRVSNPTDKPLFFAPGQLSLLADTNTRMFSVPWEVLPERFQQMDWQRTAGTVLLSALFLLVVLASMKEGKSPAPDFVQLGFESADHASMGARQGQRHSSSGAADQIQPLSARQPGFLAAEEVKPGKQVEGFVFFQLDKTVVDWRKVSISGQ